jgi:hypothetical protein
VTTAVAEVAPPEPAITGPDEVLLVLLPAEVEEKARRLASQSQVPLADVVASWLAAADSDAPVPAEVVGAVNILLPGEVVALLRAEAKRRGLPPEVVASARLAAVAAGRF